MRKASVIMKELSGKKAVARRKAEREEIKQANDTVLKNEIADMKYILNIRSQMSALNPVELHAKEILKEATTKTQRFYAIKRLKNIINK